MLQMQQHLWRLAGASMAPAQASSSLLTSAKAACSALLSGCNSLPTASHDSLACQYRQASTSRSSVSTQKATESPAVQPPVGLTPISPFNIEQQSSITIDGKQLTGDPGTQRYTAPVYIPEEHRKGMLRVLYAEPWAQAEDKQVREQHARMCLEYLRQLGKPATAVEVFEGMNAQGPSKVFGSLEYVKMLLEHLRERRFVYGQSNRQFKPDARNRVLSNPGHPAHPRLYVPLKYQQIEAGSPTTIARRKEEEQAVKVQRAMKRLRNSKPPFPIFRRQASLSIFQHEVAAAEMRKALANALPAGSEQ